MKQLIFGFNPIFRKKAEAVTVFDDALREEVSQYYETLNAWRGAGLAAPMVGVSKQIAIVDLYPSGISEPYTLINPKLLSASEETQTFEEGSLSFPYVYANITRPREVTYSYQDEFGKTIEKTFSDFLAQVVQHECDYLEGKLYFDTLSKLKRDSLLKKMEKLIKTNGLPHPHAHPHTHHHGCGCG